jgi:hypothetical protein
MVKPKTNVVYRFVPNDVAKEKRWMATAIWAEGSDSNVVVVVVVVFVSRLVAPTATNSAKDRTALELCNAGVIHGCCGSFSVDDEAEDNAVVPDRRPPPEESAITTMVGSMYRCPPPRRPTDAGQPAPFRWNDQAATVGFVDKSNSATDHTDAAAIIMMMGGRIDRVAGPLFSSWVLDGSASRRMRTAFVDVCSCRFDGSDHCKRASE